MRTRIPLVLSLLSCASACALEVGESDSVSEATQSLTVRVDTAAKLVAALASARSGDIVEVPDGVEINLSNRWDIVVPAGVTLRGTRNRLVKGALLYTNTLAKRTLFVLGGDGASITNLRIRGPSDSKADDLEPTVGIEVSTEFDATVADNELYNWPHAAVEVFGTNESDTCEVGGSTNFPVVRITRNYIHHNQRSGLGYGVVVMRGGFPWIEKNTFDSNRHAIAADGRARTSYYAFYNLVLEGGGEYCDAKVFCWYEHHFDMHGRDNDGHDGGIAGNHVWIGSNTFRGEQEYGFPGFRKTRAAYHVRGTPCDDNVFQGNVLVHESGEAVRNDSEEDNVSLSNNQYDVDTSYDVAVGDFDGDDRDDLFMATGAAWYYSSGGQADWRFLAVRPNRLSTLRFGDFDGDGRTDVFTSVSGEWRISRGGTEAWTTINTSGVSFASLRFGDFNGDGRTDVFKANGSDWHVSYSGTGSWTRLGSSQLVVEELRFGNFNSDARTDIFSFANGQWSVSYGGTGSWTRLNSELSNDLESLVFADFDGNGRTDIVQSRLVAGFPTSNVEWRVSWNGTGGWTRLRLLSAIDYVDLSRHWIGRFDGALGMDAIRYDDRSFVRSTNAASPYVAHSRQPMR